MDFQIEWLDHPKRCNYPLKRVGDRGSGKWERITWDQACKEIGEKMRYLADEYGPETVIFSHGTGRTDEWYEGRFFNLYGSPNLAMGGSEICCCLLYTSIRPARRFACETVAEAPRVPVSASLHGAFL